MRKIGEKRNGHNGNGLHNEEEFAKKIIICRFIKDTVPGF
jgi:hypothetical protein